MQSIIVYRNPLEQQVWESISDGSFFPYMVAMAVFVAIVVGIGTIIEKQKFHHWSQRYSSWLIFVPAILGAMVVIWIM